MTRDELQLGVLEPPAAQRRDLIEELWRSLESDPEPLPDWQRKLLDERLEDLEVTPDEGDPWEVVDRRVWVGEE